MKSCDSVYQLRADLEREYVSVALSAVYAETVSMSDLAAVCPPECIAEGSVQASIYRAMCEIGARGERPTMVNVFEHITAARQRKEKGWADVSALDIGQHAESLFAGNEDHVFNLAESVAREARKRTAELALLRLAEECRRYATETGEIATACAAVAQGLEGTASAEHTLDGALDRMLAVLESGAAAAPLPTPWPSLNRVLKGGMVPGELAVLAARPGMGKTALAGCIAVETARQGIPVLFISREVKEYTLTARITAREARIDSRIFREGIASAPNVLQRIRRTRDALAGLPLRIVEKSIAPMCPREVRRLAKATAGVGLVVVDYLQLLQPDTKTNSREREVAEMSRSMKQLALDCDCPVLLLSQLNRRVEDSDRAPQLSDLRESGAIEQDADIVMFIHARKGNAGLAKMPVDVIVGKGRSSGTGVAHLRFDKPFADFVEDARADAWQANFPQRQDNGL